MTLGPIEIVVLAFPGSQFNGEIRPRIEELIERDIIRIVDALFITKDAEGTVAFLELGEFTDDVDALAFGAFISAELELLSDEDVAYVADSLEPGSSALTLVFEHVWMKPVREAIIDSGGVLLADIHVPADVVDDVVALVESA